MYLHIVNETLSTENGCNLIPLYILSAVLGKRITVTHRFALINSAFLFKQGHTFYSSQVIEIRGKSEIDKPAKNYDNYTLKLHKQKDVHGQKKSASLT